MLVQEFSSPGKESFSSLGHACVGREIGILGKAVGRIASSYGSALSTPQGHPEVQGLRPGSAAGPRRAHPTVTSRLLNATLSPYLMARAGWEDGWTASVADELASSLPVLCRKVLRFNSFELVFFMVVACRYLQETSHLHKGVSSVLMCKR